MRLAALHVQKSRIAITQAATTTGQAFLACSWNKSRARRRTLVSRNVSPITLPITPVMLQSLSFSSQAADASTDNLFAVMNRRARGLLDEQALPPGSFTDSHGLEARSILDFFKRAKTTDEDTVNLSIRLIERLFEEMAVSKDGARWICEPRYFNSILNIWKNAAKQGRKVIKPMDLFQKLQAVSRKRPDFRFDKATIAIIMSVVIKQAHPRKAPFVVEDLLNFLQREAAEKKRLELQPNAFIYNNVIHAWAVSGLPQAPDKMNSLIQNMRQERTALDSATYNILLRYWAGKGSVEMIEAILDTMKKERVVPTTPNVAQAIYCYAKAGRTEKAQEMLENILEVQPENEKEACMVAESVQNILHAYRMVVDDHSSSFSQKEKAVEDAEALFEKMSKSAQMTDEDHGELIVHVACTRSYFESYWMTVSTDALLFCK